MGKHVECLSCQVLTIKSLTHLVQTDMSCMFYALMKHSEHFTVLIWDPHLIQLSFTSIPSITTYCLMLFYRLHWGKHWGSNGKWKVTVLPIKHNKGFANWTMSLRSAIYYAFTQKYSRSLVSVLQEFIWPVIFSWSKKIQFSFGVVHFQTALLEVVQITTQCSYNRSIFKYKYKSQHHRRIYDYTNHCYYHW